MGTNKYDEVEESCFDNPLVIRGIIKRLAAHEEAFKTGDRPSLFAALCLCAQYQAVIPAWAADAILQGKTDLDSGESKDFNALFGWNLPNQRNRQREVIIKDNSGDVLERLVKHRCDGGTLSAEEAFGPVSEETGLPRRIVDAIYKQNPQAIKSIPQGNPGGGTYSIADLSIPIQRRYERKIL